MENSNDSFVKKLPGSSDDAQEKVNAEMTTIINKTSKLTPVGLKSVIDHGYRYLWPSKGYNPFPMVYKRGRESYGRVSTIPGSTVCNLKREPKNIILREINRRTGLSFVEVDLKSCHGVIFEKLTASEKTYVMSTR